MLWIALFKIIIDKAKLIVYTILITCETEGGGDFKKWLRNKRAESGLTLKELGAEVGCSPGNWCDVESGRRKPSVSLAKRIAKYFKEPADRIVFFACGKDLELEELLRSFPKQARNLISATWAQEVYYAPSITEHWEDEDWP